MNNFLLKYANLSFSFDKSSQNKLDKITKNIINLEKVIKKTKQELLNEKRRKANIIIEQLNKEQNAIPGEILCFDNVLLVYTENKWRRYYEEEEDL